MAVSYYLTHPEVRINPDVPVPFWGLNEIGQARAEAFARGDLLPTNAIFISSEETKAEELAEILATRHGNPIVTRPDLGENDRSSTGFLPSEAFERLVHRFFAHPEQSIEGWETAKAAQTRIVGAVEQTLAQYGTETPLVFAGHGGVGTLFKCFIAGRPIAQIEDQRVSAHAGGGNLFAFDLAAKRLLCEWTSFENWKGS